MKVEMTYNNFEKACNIIDEMEFKAGEMLFDVPKNATEILQNLNEYIFFLIWYQETANNTEENEVTRKFVKKILNERLILIEDNA